MGSGPKAIPECLKAILAAPVAEDPTRVRRELAEAIREAVDADAGVWYSVVECERALRIGNAVFTGDKAVRPAIDVLLHDPLAFPSLTRFRRPESRETTQFLELESLFSRREIEATPFYERAWEPFGIRDQIRLLAYQGDRFLGWIGALRVKRGRGFSAKERKRLAGAVEGTVNRLAHAQALERRGLPTSDAEILCRADGRVDFASEEGRRWLAVRGFADALHDAVRRSDGARESVRVVLGLAGARIARTDGNGGVRYLVHLWRMRTLRRAKDAALSAVQREIAGFAAAGATVDEIAAQLGRDRETVRSHLREIYRRLGTSSRVELAKMLRDER